MPYTSTFVREFSLGGLPPSAVRRGVTAANGLVALFGPDWIQRVYPGQKSPVFVRRAIAQWDQWRQVRRLPGADPLAQRLRHPNDDAWTEVYVVVRLMRAGVSVELEPIVGDGKVDCRFRTNQTWIYVEVTKRSTLARVLRSSEALINQLAQGAAGAVPGRHGVVALLREPREGEVATVRSWLRNCGAARAVLDDLAIYDSLPWEEPANEPPGVTFSPDEPRLWAMNAASNGIRGSASVPVVDSRAEAILRAEARQLPRGGGRRRMYRNDCRCGELAAVDRSDYPPTPGALTRIRSRAVPALHEPGRLRASRRAVAKPAGRYSLDPSS